MKTIILMLMTTSLSILSACKKPVDVHVLTPLEINEGKLSHTWIQTGCTPYCDSINFGVNGRFRSVHSIYDSFQVLSIDSIRFFSHYLPNTIFSDTLRYEFLSDVSLKIYCYDDNLATGCGDGTFNKK